MTDLICPHCQQIIDDGSDGFTSNREIELEKKLDIAVEALEEYMTFCRHPAQEALAKIKEIK